MLRRQFDQNSSQDPVELVFGISDEPLPHGDTVRDDLDGGGKCSESHSTFGCSVYALNCSE